MSNSRIPQPHHPFAHRQRVQVRFNDIDLMGHINNTVLLQFYDLGKLRYFEAVMGCPFAQMPMAMVVVNINCDFYAPSTLDEPLEVLTQCVRIGEKSLTLEQRLVNTATAEVKSTCRTVMAGFDPHTLAPAAVPATERARFSAYEGVEF